MRSLQQMVQSIEKQARAIQRAKDWGYCQCGTIRGPITLFAETDEEEKREYEEKLAALPSTCEKCGKPIDPKSPFIVISFYHTDHPEKGE